MARVWRRQRDDQLRRRNRRRMMEFLKKNENEIQKKPFKFIKLILPSTLHSQTMRIPEKFVTYCKLELSRNATLGIPTGVTWNVEMTESEDGVHFTGQGWVDFMEHNGLEYGYFLEFEYEGSNHFDVSIVNLSCSEIDYPTESKHGSDNHDSEDISDNPPYFTVTARRYSISSCAGCAAYLHIPKSFTNEHMGGKTYRFVELQADDGRKWHVDCYYNAGIRLVGGWKKFETENNWIEGQKYTFVLVNKKCNSLVFKVSKN